MLSVFGEETRSVVALAGDNCSTNTAITTKLNIFLVVCHRHSFNLAVTDILSIHEDLLSVVRFIMKKLRHLVSAVNLRRITSLKSKVDYFTRWCLSFHMLLRYPKLRDFPVKLEMDEMNDLLLSLGESKRTKVSWSN